MPARPSIRWTGVGAGAELACRTALLICGPGLVPDAVAGTGAFGHPADDGCSHAPLRCTRAWAHSGQVMIGPSAFWAGLSAVAV